MMNSRQSVMGSITQAKETDKETDSHYLENVYRKEPDRPLFKKTEERNGQPLFKRTKKQTAKSD